MTIQIIEIDYTNWRGERRKRQILPFSFILASNEWHKEIQWFCIAKDIVLEAERWFALSGIHSWTVVKTA